MRFGAFVIGCWVFFACGLFERAVHASVDLSLVAMQPAVAPGDTFSVQVVLTAPAGPEIVSAVQMIFGWDTTYLSLVGLTQSGAVPLLASSFPANDPFGINGGVTPPTVSPGFYQAFAQFGNPVAVGAGGTLLTTFIFEALQPTMMTWIDIIPSAGSPLGHTVVFDGASANTDITGVMTGASLSIIPAPSGLCVLAMGLLMRSRRRSIDGSTVVRRFRAEGSSSSGFCGIGDRRSARSRAHR